MASNGNESFVQKFLLSGNKSPPVKSNYFQPNKSTLNNGSSTVFGGIGGKGIGSILAYFLAILVVIFIILLFIHFFIKPIFVLRPGSPGIIPVPGFDDGKLFWDKTNQGQILNKDLPISQQFCTYSFILDMFIQNPLQFSNYPRILFSRGAERRDKPTGDSILGVFSNYNIAVALASDTNDLIVSVLNNTNNMESVVIPNVPIQEPFRLGVVFMDAALEVYINGHLMQTRKFDAPPKDVRGDIYPASGVEGNIAILRNLKIWNRILTTNQIRYATPPLSNAKDFNAGPIPTSTNCPSLSRLEKLSA
jgi:hypothetical protein